MNAESQSASYALAITHIGSHEMNSPMPARRLRTPLAHLVIRLAQHGGATAGF
jgi:hypothetical protein